MVVGSVIVDSFVDVDVDGFFLKGYVRRLACEHKRALCVLRGCV